VHASEEDDVKRAIGIERGLVDLTVVFRFALHGEAHAPKVYPIGRDPETQVEEPQGSRFRGAF
jgi:hypothetical protein